MTTPNPIASLPTAPPAAAKAGGGLREPAASPTQERLRRIEALGQRIHGHIQFMCQVDGLSGTSAEAKESAVTAFHDQLAVLERRLDRIQENLRLG